MKHPTIIWNPATEEWFCVKCGRSSDHLTLQDAQWELNQYDCGDLSTELPKGLPHDPST
jgi:hypothetical protein